LFFRMWFEERSWSNLRMSDLVEEWRDLWAFKVDFIVAAISYVFATTNFLNLPKLILENGGMAFVCAYGVVLAVLVLPTILLELAVGQLTGRAPVQAFYHLSPVFKGIGISQVLFTLLVLATMTRFLGWLFLFVFHLFWTIQADRPGLPWLNCKYFPELLSPPCRDAGSMANFTLAAHTKLSTVREESSLIQFMSALERPSASISDFGEFQYYLLAAQGLVWILVFCGVCFGVRWLGKVIPFLFMAAFSMLLALLIRASTMDGLMNIFTIYIDATDWSRLADYNLWKIVSEQAILATGIGFGAFITMGSYNRRSNNLVRLVSLRCFILFFNTNLSTTGKWLISISYTLYIKFVGFVVSKTGLTPFDVMDKGEAQMWHILAYFSYLPNVKLWSGLLLFASICILLNIFPCAAPFLPRRLQQVGQTSDVYRLAKERYTKAISCSIPVFEITSRVIRVLARPTSVCFQYLLSLSVLATLEDALGDRWSRCFPRFVLALFVCSLTFAISLYFATQAGRHAYELVTGFLKYVTIFVILTFELFATAWFYCAHRLGMDLHLMLRNACCWCFGHFILFFTYLLPIIPAGVALLNLHGYDFSTFSPAIHSWRYSEWVGAGVALGPLLPIPLFLVFAIMGACCCRGKQGLSRGQRLRAIFASNLRRDHRDKASSHPRYTSSAPGYLLLPQAPLAEPETYA
uniref:Transporter n=1 Tax=Heligmosomoides polygyrus TaxID=6339 RepID=A0A183FM54_HELPZ